jgi:hypothetical protein
MRVFARRERPHPGAQLSLFEAAGGWRYSLWVTNLPAATRGWRGQCAYIDAAHRVHARVEDGILLQGSSTCRLTLHRSALRGAFATHLVGVVLVVVAAQKPGQRGPATCTTTPRGDGGWMMTPLPARSAKTPDLYQSSPLEKAPVP